VRALVVLAFMVPVVACVWLGVRAYGRRTELSTQPSRDLAQAIRLLDKAMACDDVMPYMSSDVRAEIRAVLDRYRGRELT
jgi:hypothetical protein